MEVIKECFWCRSREGEFLIARFKTTSKRITKKILHKACIKKLLAARPTEKNAKFLGLSRR